MEKIKWDKFVIKDLSEVKKDIWNKMLNNQNVKNFINQYQIPNEVINENLGYFAIYLENEEECSKCKGYYDCPKLTKGFICELIYDEEQKKVNIEYRICDQFAKVIKQKNGFVFYEYDDTLFDRRNIKLDDTINRVQIIERMGKLIINKTNKGLYIYGKSGVGKSYLLAFMAHKFVDLGKKCAFISTATLIDKLRSLLIDDNAAYNEEINKFKNVDVLVLDDIGGEKITAWGRDEVLYSILDYRMKNKELITCFSSNYSVDEYQKVASLQDEKRADRLISRIVLLADEFELVDVNRRL